MVHVVEMVSYFFSSSHLLTDLIVTHVKIVEEIKYRGRGAMKAQVVHIICQYELT